MKKIFTQKDNGGVSMPINLLFVFLFIVILFWIIIDYQRLQYLSNQITDVLTDAMLGAGTLTEDDAYLLGLEDKIMLTNPKENYSTFQEILKKELDLTNTYEYTRNEMIRGKVNIEEFIVYNVDGPDVYQYTFYDLENYTLTEYPHGHGVVTAPNGMPVINTSLYTEISFNVNFIHKEFAVVKEHMVDIRRN